MADKNKKVVKPSEKKMVQNLLMNHPEVTNNARHLFRNENGRTIVEDRVPRGDQDRRTVGQPFCQGDLTDADLRDLAKYATEILDEGIMRYDERTAKEDALHRAIDQKDGGKYAGKVGAVTYNLILSHVGKGAKAPVEKKANVESLEIESSKEPEEAQMSNLGEMAKVAEFIANQTPEQRIILKAMIKEAADQNDPKRWQKTMDSIGVKAPKSKNASEDEDKDEDEKKAKKHDENEKDHEEKETEEEKKLEEKVVEEEKEEEEEDKKEEKEEEKEKKEEKEDEDKDASIVESLDSIASELEQSGDYDLFKVAYQIDQVTDVLEGRKTAATLESDPDEKYMREAFQSTIRQKEKDEKYMDSFSTDKTQEVNKCVTKRPYGIVK